MKKIFTLCLLAFTGLTTLNAQCFKTISAGSKHTIAIKTDGSLWAWGNNGNGQLGDGTNTQRNSPVQIGSATNWASVSAGSAHTIALKTDGTLWAWGNNANGQLANGIVVDRYSPIQIGSATNWASISAGSYHNFATQTDGSLWAWGDNVYGELGDGTFANRYSPIRIGTATNWANIRGGLWYTLATQTNGSLWAWGDNSKGQLGDGTTTNRISPVQIGTATNWASIGAGDYHSLATKTDGSLWTWGWNYSGQLGDGTTTDRNNPLQIGFAMNWASISGGRSHSIATQSDGSLWAWGYNGSGQLGDGTTTDRNSPVQIDTATNWASIDAGYSYGIATQTNGSLWAWGRNVEGQLGYGVGFPSNVSPSSIACTSACTPTTGSFTVSACNSYTWAAKGNKVYTASNNTDTIHLTNAGGCDSLVTLNLTILNTLPSISGTNAVCAGSTIPLSNAISGGVWVSNNNRATVNASGIVTGRNLGTAIIKYTVAGCGSVTKSFTVNSLPNVPIIQYVIGTVNPQKGVGGSFCANKTFTVVGTPSSGLWSSTGLVSVGASSGVVTTGSSAGAATLTYTYTNANGCSNSRTITGRVAACAARGVNGANNGQLAIDNEQFTIFPNPAKSFISLNVNSLMGAGTIVVNDLYGKQVKAQSLSMGTNTVDIANLAKGMYFVSTITNEGKTTQKLVVE
jgi:alpha-tubulin suppressor-like RCC1 family protein